VRELFTVHAHDERRVRGVCRGGGLGGQDDSLSNELPKRAASLASLFGRFFWFVAIGPHVQCGVGLGATSRLTLGWADS